ncbi:hypothetical protein J5N97_023120 [Dioscorea zingiberensis]|uniref:Thaumatin-like protein n=1 Tax=Dioscorea zingiberensis TaxID=325984 RepID=A0A9D5CBQ3_9LILI|nr:hypothetical protein J5N97_023120 [Dioscorea zingiberensis]
MKHEEDQSVLQRSLSTTNAHTQYGQELSPAPAPRHSLKPALRPPAKPSRPSTGPAAGPRPAAPATPRSSLRHGRPIKATGSISCSGSGAIPPATLAEITLGTGGSPDFYDISLVDGYNLPVSLVPVTQTKIWMQAWQYQNINLLCPSRLQVSGDGGVVVACRSACEAFGDPMYCCTGAYGNPNTCKATYFSSLFKSACPAAYSYAFDDPTSTFTCDGGPDYLVIFCP